MEEKIFNEAIERMKMLKLSNQCINAFRKGKVWESKNIGALYEVNEKEQEIINKFERNNKGYKVYHMIHNKYEFGEYYSILYVSTNISEWKYDREDINNGYILAYVENVDYEYFSEFGSIVVKSNIGGLIRLG